MVKIEMAEYSKGFESVSEKYNRKKAPARSQNAERYIVSGEVRFSV